jgi:hypothetical protein
VAFVATSPVTAGSRGRRRAPRRCRWFRG